MPIPTAAVDALWPDGRIEALPSLLHARQGAQVVALPDGGFFVAGGTADKKSPPLESLPVEWLAGAAVASGAPWVTLDAQFSKDAVFGHLANGQVLALTAGTNLQSLVFADTGKGRPTVGFNALPGLPHERRNAEDSRVLIKGLSDGRIIAAGGDVQDGRSKAARRNSMRRGTRSAARRSRSETTSSMSPCTGAAILASRKMEVCGNGQRMARLQVRRT